MSTIERLMERQGHAPQHSNLREKATEESVNIDLALLSAKGMLNPQTDNNQVVEEFRAIKRELIKNIAGRGVGLGDRPANLIMVTSALPGEGKSFNSISVAMSFAMEMDYTVLLVEADVARPALARYLAIENPARKGLVDYLAEPKLDLSEVLVKTNVPKLTLLPAGRRHARATELLSSESMRRLMRELAQRYSDRVVIFDSPPLLMSSEAVVLAGMMGQIVLVVESGKTPQHLVKDALGLIDRSQVAGVVLNKCNKGIGLGYGYYGPYGY